MSDEARSEERERAEYQSRKCKRCNGSGMAIVFHDRWEHARFATVETERNGELVPESFPVEVAAHCICPIGRWMRFKTSDALRARIPDGADIAEGRSVWSFPSLGSQPDGHYEAPSRDAITRFGRIPEAQP